MSAKSFPLIVILVTLSPRGALAESITFSSGVGNFQIEFVTIGDIGNPHDSRMDPPMGSVDYEYQIAKFEMSCQMFISPIADSECPPGESLPKRFAALEAMQYANWLNELAGHQPAYRINDNVEVTSVGLRVEPWAEEHPGYYPDNVWRNSLAKFFLSTKDEWHKAAYFDPKEDTYRLYATGDEQPDLVPDGGGTSPNTANFFPNIPYVPVDMAGGLSVYGTMGQTGNVPEWEELDYEPGMTRGIQVRNGVEDGDIRQHTAINSRRFSRSSLEGIRIVAATPLPEPSTATLLVITLCSLGAVRRRR